ncbi:MAG: carbohydrate ABC transporter permease [Treponema sp.]|jgi:raffinose/stachyose/melibiose transport system permease protein|nr:carbohydrate ABC transporter permease [Treponema sp.]
MADVRKRSFWVTLVVYPVMFLFTFFAVYPILWLIIQSFKTTQEYVSSSKLALPKVWFAGNYVYAWRQGNFGILVFNSVFYTGVTVTVVILLAFMAGFAFSKIKNRATPVLHGIYIIGILLTLQSIMVPLFLLINSVRLLNTRLGVLIPYIGIGLPMGVYLSTEYIRNIPDSLVESARIDGAKYLRIFVSIIFPMAMPVAITVAILTFTGTWNEFMLINILTSRDSLKSIPVGINKFSGAQSSDYGKQFAALVIGLIPMVAFYLIFRKQITKGVAAGAVKS